MESPARSKLDGEHTCSKYQALYNHFIISLASGYLRLEDFNRHVAAVLQVLQSMAKAYASVEESCGNKSAQDAIAMLRCGVLELYNSISSEWAVDVSYPQNPEVMDYCFFVTENAPPDFTENGAFVLAGILPFVRLSAFIVKELKEVSQPSSRFCYWIDKFAFEASWNETLERVNLCLTTDTDYEVTGDGMLLESRYYEGMRLAVKFFCRQQVTTVNSFVIVPLTTEHNPAREQILLVCGLDSSCCLFDSEAHKEQFMKCMQTILPVVKVGYVHENVVGALRQIAEFEIKTRGLAHSDEPNNFSGFSALLHNINSNKNNFNASVHIVSSLCNHEMQSAVSSGWLKESSLHTSLESNIVKFDLFMELGKNTNQKKLLKIYVGNSFDDLGCLLEADIGILLGPCNYMLSVCTQFGVTFETLLERLVKIHKQMNEGIHSIWQSKRGILYTVKGWDEITAFMFGAFERPKEIPFVGSFAGSAKPKNVENVEAQNVAPQKKEDEHQDRKLLVEKEEDTSAPPEELFDISTTVDPIYVISVIRKLLPASACSNHNSRSAASCVPVQGLNTDEGENETEQPGHGVPVGEEAWEEYGRILWKLSASKTHAEFLVQNLVVEVLLAHLEVSQFGRTTELVLGIIANLICHEVSRKYIVSNKGSVDLIVDQLFLGDGRCFCQLSRLLTVGLQSSEGVIWAEALQPENKIVRILWIAEQIMRPQLKEQSAKLLLAIIKSSQDVVHILLPPLMMLGLASLLINLLDFEMSKLMDEKAPERYPILDVILQAIEALSIIDGHSQEICLNEKLFQLVCKLLKFPDKAEVASSCITATVLVASILSEVPTLASGLSQDMPFLQGLLDVFPFTSDDLLESRSALWNIISRLLVRVRENEMSSSALQQYVSVLVSKSDVIEDDLLNCQLGGVGLESRAIALRRIISILNQRTASKDYAKESENDVDIDRLLDCCNKHSEQEFLTSWTLRKKW